MRPTEINPEKYPEQLAQKAQRVKEQFSEFDPGDLEVFASAPLHYRMRAEFRVWHEGDDLYHIMFDTQTKEKYRVDQFPPASELINQVMASIIPLLKSNEIARRKLFQIDYLSTLSGEILVSLLYHKALDDAWIESMKGILATLRQTYAIHIVGRARKQKICLDQDFVTEVLPVNESVYRFQQIENSFTQPNAGVNSKMIQWCLDVTGHCDSDLLELYCGLGNFSIPLAQNFRKVLATEISKTSVAAAQLNIRQNHAQNVTILRMSSEEFVEAQQGKRSFRRLDGVELSEYQCDTVLVDPPRAGLDPKTIKMVSEYQRIVYISCNPDTLLENVGDLSSTHQISRFALFDQFPYTHHAECGVLLERR